MGVGDEMAEKRKEKKQLTEEPFPVSVSGGLSHFH